jgi:hypothetical protein
MNRKVRIAYAVLFLLLLIAEVLIALFVHDSFIRPYLGDVLVTVLICAFCCIFVPKGIRLLPLYVFLFAAAVEVSQYFGLVRALGLGDIPFFAILMGTTFSVYDLICYGVGCLAFFAIGFVVKKFCRG